MSVGDSVCMRWRLGPRNSSQVYLPKYFMPDRKELDVTGPRDGGSMFAEGSCWLPRRFPVRTPCSPQNRRHGMEGPGTSSRFLRNTWSSEPLARHTVDQENLPGQGASWPPLDEGIFGSVKIELQGRYQPRGGSAVFPYSRPISDHQVVEARQDQECQPLLLLKERRRIGIC